VKENCHKSGYSLAHGAGRKMARSKAHALMQNQNPNPRTLLKTDFDSIVVCENKTLIYEEAPAAYKNIDLVVQDLVELGLVKVIASLKPLLTYKFKEPGFGNKS
jgi:release factor H-coupled RctB family protein